MRLEPPSDRESLYRAYQRELLGDRSAESLRFGIRVVVGLNACFPVLDYWVHREEFIELVSIRLIYALVMGVAYAVSYRLNALAATRLGCLLAGFGLVWVIAAAGGTQGEYAPGLMLLFLGMPVLLPLSSRQATEIVSAVMVAFLAVPLLYEDRLAVTDYLLYAFFPSATAIECVASCAILDRMRFTDFLQRAEIEKARDELAEMDRAKSRFTANVHHELRTPLTLMLAPLEALRGGDFGQVPQRIEEVLRTMQANGLRLLKLINNLLDLAKVESEQLEVRRVPLELGRLLGDVVAGAKAMAERKGVALELEAPAAGLAIHADPEALEKIFVNLIGNALKFTDSGGITVRAEAEADGAVHVQVRDTGIGIPPAQLEKVFDRFAQVDASATRRHEGTGIGLSLVKELVALHGGRAWAESAGEGQGTTMHVVLPRGEADAELEEEAILSDDGERALSAAHSFRALASEMALDLEAAAPARFAELEHTVSRWEGGRAAAEAGLERLPSHPSGTPEVVVAEDNVEMRRLLSFLIGREFLVRPCRNGREALEKARERPPALVVTDVMMPEMSGTELCRALKADPATRGVPVMLVTSKAEREMKIEGLELGAEDYVTKPFHPRELMARVRALVRLRELQQEIADRNASLERSNRELAQALRELKEAEVQLVKAERLAAVGELSAGVAHEVNNPLNFARNSLATLTTYVDDVRGLVQRVSELDVGDRAKLAAQLEAFERAKADVGFDEVASGLSELVAIVTEGLDRTSRLVSDLRDFAAPHRGGRSLVDVGVGLRSTLQLLGHRLRRGGARMELDLPEALPRVEGDAGALNQVFLNVLKNAAEAIEGQGGGTIHVSARAEGTALAVRIRDEGPGMDSEALSHLFEPFFTTKEAGRGTGLGLSMSRRIVEEHGGTIEVESAPGEGTAVTVRLPAPAQDAA